MQIDQIKLQITFFNNFNRKDWPFVDTESMNKFRSYNIINKTYPPA